MPLRRILLIGCTRKPTNEIRPLLFSSINAESKGRKRISYVKAGVVIVDQVKPAIPKAMVLKEPRYFGLI